MGFILIEGGSIDSPGCRGVTLKELSWLKSKDGAMLYLPSELFTVDLTIA